MTMTDVGQVIPPTFVSLLLLVTAKVEQWGQIWSVSNLEIISLKKINNQNVQWPLAGRVIPLKIALVWYSRRIDLIKRGVSEIFEKTFRQNEMSRKSKTDKKKFKKKLHGESEAMFMQIQGFFSHYISIEWFNSNPSEQV